MHFSLFSYHLPSLRQIYFLTTPNQCCYRNVQQQVSHAHETTVPYILRSPTYALYKLQTNKFNIPEAHLQSQARPCEICGGQSGKGTSVSSSTSVSPVIIPPTLHTRVHLDTNLIRRTSGQCLGTLRTIQFCPPSRFPQPNFFRSSAICPDFTCSLDRTRH